MARATAPLTRAYRFLDRPPPGWHAVLVLRERDRSWDWVALMVEPADEAPGVWVRIPGKHRNKAAAEAALQDLLATRH